MHNPGQTWIFYKAGQIRLTRTKCDPVDPDNLDDPTWLQRWSPPGIFLLVLISNFKNTNKTTRITNKWRQRLVCGSRLCILSLATLLSI